jgi:prefoldin alpha subunit
MAKTREDVEADLQNLLGVLQNTRDQLEQLRTQAELMRISLEEHRTAIDTLEAYKDVREHDEVLLPVGANAFIFANASATKSAVTELGAGVSASLPIDVAVEKLRKRIERIESSRKKMVEGGQRLEASAQALEEQIQSMYASLSGTAPSGRAAPARGRGAAHAHDHGDDD